MNPDGQQYHPISRAGGSYASNLASSQPAPVATAPSSGLPEPGRNWAKTAVLVLGGLIALAVVTAGVILFTSNKQDPESTISADKYTATSIPLSELASTGQLAIDSDQQLTVNGQLKINNGFVVAPSAVPSKPVAGQIYYDQTKAQLGYYNGSQFVALTGPTSVGGLTGVVGLGPGISTTGASLTNTGVLSVQGLTGNVTLLAGSGIAINGRTISSTVSQTSQGITAINGGTGLSVVQSGNTVSISLPQDLRSSAVPTFAGLQLSVPLGVGSGGTGATSFTAGGLVVGNGGGALGTIGTGNSGECLISGGSSAPSFQACPGASPNLITSGTSQTAGKLTKFDSTTNTITDSLVSELGTTVTVSGALSVTSSVTAVNFIGNGSALTNLNGSNISSGTVAIGVGGTGINVTPANGQLLIGNGSGYTLANITNSDGTVAITNGPGTIDVSVPRADQCSLCADHTLSNLSSVSINTSLLPQSAGAIDIGSGSLPIRDIYLAGSSASPSSNNFKITGTSTGGTRTINLPDGSGTICISPPVNSCQYVMLQALTPGSAQSGNININGTIISGVLNVGTTATVGSLTVNNNAGVTGNLAVTGTATAASFNGLSLTNGANPSVGVSGKTLTILGDASINQSLLTTSNVTFNAATLTTALGISSGGTGLGSTPGNGKLLIGNGTGYSLANLASADGTIVVTNGVGTIDLSAPGSGTCASCANTSLSNLASLNINTSLLAQSNVDLGSGTKAFRNIYIYGSAASQANNFKITGTATGGTKTITLPDANGTVCLDTDNCNYISLQSTTPGSVQTGNINISGTVIASALQSNSLQSANVSAVSTDSNAVTLRSGDATGASSTSGDVTITTGTANAVSGTSGSIFVDVGTGNITGGITIGGANAQTIIIGHAGIDTQVAGTINGQTLSPSANFTGTLSVQGANALTLGTASTNTGAILFNNNAGANAVTLKAADINPTSSFTLTLPSALGSTGDCIKQTGLVGSVATLGFVGCASGLGGAGTANHIAQFNATGTALQDSSITDDGTNISIQGGGKVLTVEGKVVVGLNGASGNVGIVDFRDGSNPGRTVSVQAQSAGSSYTLQLPTTADVGSTCLTLVNVSAGVNKIAGGSCAAGGSGGNVTATGLTNGHLARFTTDGPSYSAAASMIQDDSTGIGINTAPSASYILRVGSQNKFNVTDAGQLEIGTTGSNPLTLATNGNISNVGTLSGTGLFQTTAAGQAVTISGAPSNTANQSLVRIGNAINTAAGNGNVAVNGGTYLSVNAPGTGAGSAADFLNFQANGTAKLRVDSSGNFITAGTYNGLTLSQAASQFSITGGTGTARTLNVTGNTTVNQDLSTTSNTVQFGRISSLSTKLEAAQGGTGSDTSGSLAGATLLFDATNGKFVGSRITSSDSSLNLTYGDGSLDVKVNSCTTCANTALSNLSNVAIQGSSLKTGTSGIDLGSSTQAFRDIYLYGAGTYGSASFKITGTPTANRTLTLPDGTGTVCVLEVGNCTGVNGGGITGSGTAGKLAVYTGTGSTIGDSIVSQSGGTLTVGGNLSVSGTVSGTSFNALTLTSNVDGFSIAGGTTSRTLTVSAANVSLNQSLLTSSNVQFANGTFTGTLSVTGNATIGNGSSLTVNTIAPSTSNGLTIGATGASQTTTVQGETVSFTNGAHAYSFNSTAAGSHTICDSSGNCAGAGGGVTNGGVSGTVNKLAKFTSGNQIGDSIVTDNGTTLSVAGNLSVTGTGAFTGSLAANGGITTSGAAINAGTGALTAGAINGSGVTQLTRNGTGTNDYTFGVTGAPVSDAGSSLIRIGLGISSGNSAVNGGTYIGLNAPGAGAGSAADFINFQAGGSSKLRITNAGDITALGAVTLGTTGQLQIGNTGNITNSGSYTGTSTIQGTTVNGTTGINTGAAGGTQRIDSSGNLVNIGNITGTGAVNLSSTGGANSLTLTSGSNTIVMAANKVQSAVSAFTIDLATAGTSTLTVSNSNGVNVASLSVTGDISVATGRVFKVGASSGTAATCSSGQVLSNQVVTGGIVTSAGSCVTAGSSAHSKKIVLTPEYTGAVLDADGTNNIGSLTSAFDATQRESYYMWTTTQSSNQDYDIVVQIALPSDFSSFNGSTPITIDRRTSDITNGVITAQLKDTAGTNATNWNTCSQTPGSANTWITTAGCTVTGGTFAADGIMTLRLHIQSPQSGDVRVGNITINYTSAY